MFLILINNLVNNLNLSNFSYSKKTPFVSKIVDNSPGYSDLNSKKNIFKNTSSAKDQNNKSVSKSNFGNSRNQSPLNNSTFKHIEEDAYLKKNNSVSIGKNSKINNSDFPKNNLIENEEFFNMNENDSRNIQNNNKKNNIPKMNSVNQQNNIYCESIIY